MRRGQVEPARPVYAPLPTNGPEADDQQGLFSQYTTCPRDCGGWDEVLVGVSGAPVQPGRSNHSHSCPEQIIGVRRADLPGGGPLSATQRSALARAAVVSIKKVLRAHSTGPPDDAIAYAIAHEMLRANLLALNAAEPAPVSGAGEVGSDE